MIREFKNEDLPILIKIIKQGIEIEEQDIEKHLKSDDIKIIVYDDADKGIIGFAYIKIWDKDNKEGDLQLYVLPNARLKGIGSLLFHEIMKFESEIKLNCIYSRFRVDIGESKHFYENHAYKMWYGMHDLCYKGSEQPKSELQFVAYEDKYFEQYAEGLRKSFYEMREVHDIQPYLCCEVNEQKRKEFLENKQNIWLLLNDGIMIGSAIIYDSGCIDDIFVVPNYQNKGYGKLITQFAINKAIRNNVNKIELGVIEWNKKAFNLYKNLGFELIQTTHYCRLLK